MHYAKLGDMPHRLSNLMAGSSNNAGMRDRSQSTGNTTDVCRVVLLGHPGVGKTALTVRFLTRRFIGEYCPTLESVHSTQLLVEEDEVQLEIMDTAGQTNASWKEAYGMWGDCFIFVYSITDRDSFEQIINIKSQIENCRKSTSLSGVVVGNKSDLSHNRCVTQMEGLKLAEDLDCQFYEVSAYDGSQMVTITNIFKSVCRDYRKLFRSQCNRQRKLSSSARFKQAITKVMFSGNNGKTTGRGRTSGSSTGGTG